MFGIDLLSFYAGMVWGAGAAVVVVILWRLGDD